MPDFCHHGDFCPAKCGKDEMSCGGHWDWETGKQITADSCIPMKVAGAKGEDCYNTCPVQCGNNDQICPGYEDETTGCKMPDACHPSDSKF